MAPTNIFVVVFVLIKSSLTIRVNFTGCQNPEWLCVNNQPNEIVYTCQTLRNDEQTIQLKDYYTNHITSVTVQDCGDLRVVLDCPILQRTSQLQRFIVKNCGRLEFITLTSTSLLQTPPTVILENIKDIVSLPKRIFKSPSNNAEVKCAGHHLLSKIRISNSKINIINTKAIRNVTGIKSIEFENVTISEIRNQAIEAIMGDAIFTISKSKVEKIDLKGILVQSTSATISENTFNDIIGNSVNITADNLRVVHNKFREIRANGLVLKFANADLSNNDINTLKSNAFTNIRCNIKRVNKKQFSFSNNKITNIEPHSLKIDYASCKSTGTTVVFDNNKIDCKCRNIQFLSVQNANTELYNIILDTANNNTCLSAPCVLPVDVLKILLENGMCHLNLDPQVMCLLYNDKHTNNSDVTSDEDITEPAPTFYLIRQANNGDASAAMTIINKDDILKDTPLNLTNRTAIKVVFDSSRDFVETLRSTSTTHKRPLELNPPREEYVNKCVGPRCRNNVAYDRQKALDFYKYVYAQLRSPILDDNKKKT